MGSGAMNRRVARREHACGWCKTPIVAGTMYVEIVIFEPRASPERNRYHKGCARAIHIMSVDLHQRSEDPAADEHTVLTLEASARQAAGGPLCSEVAQVLEGPLLDLWLKSSSTYLEQRKLPL